MANFCKRDAARYGKSRNSPHPDWPEPWASDAQAALGRNRIRRDRPRGRPRDRPQSGPPESLSTHHRAHHGDYSKNGGAAPSPLVDRFSSSSSRGRLAVEPVDLEALVEETGRRLQVSITGKITLKYNFAERPPTFDGDMTQIRQVIINLIIKALGSHRRQERRHHPLHRRNALRPRPAR